MTSLNGKVVIITGGSSGIGKACAFAFARQGCKVVITGRNGIHLHEAAAEIRKSTGAEVLKVESDVSYQADCKRIIDETLTEFGRIDILINNAGISMRALFSDVEMSVIKQLMDINFWGTVYCTKYALPEIMKVKGSIVGISSIAGIKGLPGRTGYSASKFAMGGFLESLRIENLKTGLHVMTVYPGYTASNIRKTALNKDGKQQEESPLNENKLDTPEKVAEEIVKGIFKRKKTLVLSTQGKLVVFINKFFPGLLDKMVYKTVSKEPDSPFR